MTDIDGNVVSGRQFTITAARVESRFVNGAFVDTDVDPKHCDVTSSTKPVSCSIKAGVGGQYKITAMVKDDAGGRNRSEITRWVSGAETVPTRDVEQESATVVPNQEHYRPGDTAQLLVVAPFARRPRTAHRVGQRQGADAAFRPRPRFRGRQGADRRHRHARAHGAGRPRRTGSEAARRRNARPAPAAAPGVRDRIASAAGDPGERDADRLRVGAAPRDGARRARHGRRVGEGRRRRPGRRRRCRGRRGRRGRALVDRVQARRSDRRDVHARERRAPGRLSPQQPDPGEPDGVR